MEQLTEIGRRTRAVIGTPEENLVIEAVMHFFRVAPVQRGAEQRWPARAIDAVGTVIDSLPMDVRQELLAVITREYAEYTSAATDDGGRRSLPQQSAWLPDAKDFVLARFQFLIENRLH